MTGEITLRGRVLPIGGLKEKALAAHRAGIKTVLIPKENRKDLREIPKKIRDAAAHRPGGVRGRGAARGAGAGEAGGVLPQALARAGAGADLAAGDGLRIISGRAGAMAEADTLDLGFFAPPNAPAVRHARR